MAPQQIEPAVPTRLSTVSVSHTSRKLRVAGTLLAYDVSTGLALLVERDLSRALLIDVSMCVDPSRTAPWLRDKRSVVIVTAYVEQVDSELPIPALPHRSPEPREIEDGIVLRALLVADAPDLDLDLWNSAIMQRDRAGFGAAVEG